MYLHQSLDSQGVAPFAEVVEGAAAVSAAVNAEYTSEPVVPMIVQYGNKYLQSNFPNLTFISACKFENELPRKIALDARTVASMQRLAWAKASHTRLRMCIVKQVALVMPSSPPITTVARHESQHKHVGDECPVYQNVQCDAENLQQLHAQELLTTPAVGAKPTEEAIEARANVLLDDSAGECRRTSHKDVPDHLYTGAEGTDHAHYGGNVETADLEALDELDELQI